MIIEGAEMEGLREVAELLGIDLIEQQAKNEGEIKVLVRPLQGSNRWRAMMHTGRVKHSLCMHGWYAFMARVFARYPEATLDTWVNHWDYTIFQGSALQWTRNQIAAREKYDTCDCDPRMIEQALRTPDELRLMADFGRACFKRVLEPFDANG